MLFLKKIVLVVLIILPIIVFSKKNNSLLGVTLEYPPYNYTQSGIVKGYTPDLLKLTLPHMGYHFTLRSYPWARSQIMLEEGKANFIFTYTRNKKRQEYAYYSNPVSTIKTVFAKAKNHDITWKDYADLKQYKIGANAGYNYPKEFFAAIKKYKLRVYWVATKNPTINNLKKLVMDRIDIYICPVDCQYEINNSKFINQINTFAN